MSAGNDGVSGAIQAEPIADDCVTDSGVKSFGKSPISRYNSKPLAISVSQNLRLSWNPGEIFPTSCSAIRLTIPAGSIARTRTGNRSRRA